MDAGGCPGSGVFQRRRIGYSGSLSTFCSLRPGPASRWHDILRIMSGVVLQEACAVPGVEGGTPLLGRHMGGGVIPSEKKVGGGGSPPPPPLSNFGKLPVHQFMISPAPPLF